MDESEVEEIRRAALLEAAAAYEQVAPTDVVPVETRLVDTGKVLRANVAAWLRARADGTTAPVTSGVSVSEWARRGR